jgi:hypothetical protein
MNNAGKFELLDMLSNADAQYIDCDWVGAGARACFAQTSHLRKLPNSEISSIVSIGRRGPSQSNSPYFQVLVK